MELFELSNVIRTVIVNGKLIRRGFIGNPNIIWIDCVERNNESFE